MKRKLSSDGKLTVADASKRARLKRQQQEIFEKERNRQLTLQNQELAEKIGELNANYNTLTLTGDKFGAYQARIDLKTENETLKEEVNKYRFLAVKIKSMLRLYDTVESETRVTAALDKNVHHLIERIQQLASSSAKSVVTNVPMSQSKRTARFLDWMLDLFQGNSSLHNMRDDVWNLVLNRDPFNLSHLKREVRFNKEESWFRTDVFDIPVEPERLARSWREVNSPMTYIAPFVQFFQRQPISLILKNLARTANFKGMMNSKGIMRKVINRSRNMVDIFKLETTPSPYYTVSMDEPTPLEEEDLDIHKTFCMEFSKRLKMNESSFFDMALLPFAFDDAIVEFLCYVQSPTLSLKHEANMNFLRAAIFRKGSMPGTCQMTFIAENQHSYKEMRTDCFSLADSHNRSFTEEIQTRRFEFWLRLALKRVQGPLNFVM